MSTHGADLAGCPYTGTRNDESQEWTQVYPQSSVAFAEPGDAAREQPGEGSARGPRLDPVSPNPAADYVALRYEIPVRQGVSIGIYDVSGRLVKSHLDGEMDAGEYMSQIGFAGIPAGMYYLALRTGGRTLHQRFVHVR